jgi:hypothetical protein
MHRKAVVLIAVVVVGVAWLGVRFNFDNFVSRSANDEALTSVPQIVGTEESAPRSRADDTPIDSPVPETVALEEELVGDLGASLYARFNTPFVRFLVNRGLSTQDSERVIGGAFRQAAMCWVAAVRAQVQAEGRAFDPAAERDSGELANSRMLNQLSASCINHALERVGVNPPMGIKANDA